MRRVFLLSPARVDGVRAKLLLNPKAPFPLARKFRTDGLSIAEVFTFASSLYFRGKITYARAFASGRDLIRVITANAGLLDPDHLLRPAALRAFGRVDISDDSARYRKPVLRDAKTLSRELGEDSVAVLLGSIATPKYRDPLLEVFGARLFSPADFVGRGDMSRGGLLLKAVRDGCELPYMPVQGAVLTGTRARRIRDL